MRPVKLLSALVLATALAGCAAADRLSEIGRGPALSPIKDPTASPGYRPVQLPMPAPEPVAYAPNSLWKTGARAFFKDQRARQIGDILTVKVDVADSARINNQTNRSRTGTDSMGLTGVVGSNLVKALPNGVSGSTVLDHESGSASEGRGSVNRSEQLVTNVAAVVTQTLPNGNLVVEGRQEVRVNFEVRELIVAGIIRPEDIASDNTIESTKIAEARISYGGRGQITDVQQPRYGQQLLDVILPF